MLRLVSRSNQDGISKFNTGSQLAETIIIDKNSKEHTQNRVNQKELSQLKYFSSFIKIAIKPNKKYLKIKKRKVSRQKSFNLFPTMNFIQILYVYIEPSIKTCQTQLILNCVLL